MGKPSAGKLRGFVEDYMTIMKFFLVILIGLAIVVLIISLSVWMSSVLDEFCASNPSICGSQGPNSQNDATAKASVEALVCAINSVAKGQNMCSSLSTTTQAIGRNFGFTGFAVGTQTSPAVQCQEKSQTTTETTNLKTVYSADKTAAEDECKAACGTGNVQCDTTLKSYIGYDRVRPKNTLLKCTCKYNTQETIVYAPDRQSAQDACTREFLPDVVTLSSISLSGCTEVQDEAEYNKYFSIIQGSNTQFTYMRELSSKAKKYECTFSSGVETETYFAYGIGSDAEAEARKACEDDMAYSRNTKTPLTSLDSFKEVPGEISGVLLLSGAIEKDTRATNRIEIYDCTSTKTVKSFACTVNNFQLPQKVEKMWIWTYGDPQFLAYWQVFPMDQNTWTFKVDWKIHAAIILITALPPTKIAGAFTKVGLEVAARKAGLELLKGEAARKTAGQLLKEEIKSVALKRITEQKLRAVTKLGVLEGAALATEYAASTRAKYEPEKNSVVLKLPYESKEVFALAANLERKPVFIQWKPGWLSTTKTVSAHLVSPCNIQSLSVEKLIAECGEYVFNTDTGIVSCTKGVKSLTKSEIPDITDKSSLPLCQIENYMGITDNAGLPEENLINMAKIKQMATDDVAGYFFGTKWEDYKKSGLKKCPETPYQESDEMLDNVEKVNFGNKEYLVKACYEQDDKKVTRLVVVESKFMYSYLTDYKKQVLLDNNYDGHFDSYAFRNCQTDTVVIKDVKKASTTSGEYNYCFDETGDFSKYLKAAGIAVGTGGMIAAGFFSGGTAWAVFATATVGGAALEVGGEYTEYIGKWPG